MEYYIDIGDENTHDLVQKLTDDAMEQWNLIAALSILANLKGRKSQLEQHRCDDAVALLAKYNISFNQILPYTLPEHRIDSPK